MIKLDDLMADLEETWGADGYLGLYEVLWSLRGLGWDDDAPAADFDRICRAAYQRFREQHPESALVWMTWPPPHDLSRTVPAESGTPIDLDLDHQSPVSEPLLTLIPSRTR